MNDTVVSCSILFYTSDQRWAFYLPRLFPSYKFFDFVVYKIAYFSLFAFPFPFLFSKKPIAYPILAYISCKNLTSDKDLIVHFVLNTSFLVKIGTDV